MQILFMRVVYRVQCIYNVSFIRPDHVSPFINEDWHFTTRFNSTSTSTSMSLVCTIEVYISNVLFVISPHIYVYIPPSQIFFFLSLSLNSME